jgi:hypothetical protein
MAASIHLMKRTIAAQLIRRGLTCLLLASFVTATQAGDVNYTLEPGRLPWTGADVTWDETEILLDRMFHPQVDTTGDVLLASADVPLNAPSPGAEHHEVNSLQDPERRDDAAPAAGAEQPPGQPLGQAPPDNSLVFLRTATVLLQPGQIQFDYGARYTWRDDGIPLVATIRNRQIYSPFAIRYGWRPNVQLFANMPVGFAIGEDPEEAFPGPDRFTSIFGVGDSTCGANFLVRDGYCDQCDIVGTVSMTAPLGHHPFQDISDPLRPSPTPFSGTGFWAVSANLTFIKAYDPAVIFGSIGYSHLFGRTFGSDPLNGAVVTPGEQFPYSMGVGFAINDRLTLSTAFFGTFQTTTVIDRVIMIPPAAPVVSHTSFNLEPFQVRLALTAVTSPQQIIEPFVSFGLNIDAPEADFGITCTRSF